MADEKATLLVPKLRFPGFQDRPFREVELRDVTSESRVRNRAGSPRFEVMGVSKSEGIVPMEERLVASDASRYKVVRKDWFAYNPMRLNIGSIARWRGDEDVLVSPDYVVFRCDGEDRQELLLPDFLDQFRRSDAWEAFVNEAGDGGVRVRIYYDDIAEIGLALPSLPEQQKIADCLGSLDDLIVAESRKLEARRRHKKGLMQQLFPQPGETVPRLRFPEFQDAGEWDIMKLEQACDILNSRRVPISSSNREAGPYPYYGASGVVDFVNDYIFDEELVLVGEDGAKWKAFENTAFIASGRYWVNNHAHVLKPIRTNSILLSNYLTMIDLGEFVTGAAPPKLTLGKLRSIPIPCPQIKKEQASISGILAALSRQIDLQSQKLDALNNHKRGLLQQLFPSLGATER